MIRIKTILLLAALLAALALAIAPACSSDSGGDAADKSDDDDSAPIDDDDNNDTDDDDDDGCIACDSTAECTAALGAGWVCLDECCVEIDDDDDDDNNDTEDDDDDTGDDDTPMPYWQDESTGLIWPRGMSTPYPGVTYDEAEDFCQNFSCGDLMVFWRLPTFDELRTLVVGCDSTEEFGSCPLSDDCLEDECLTADCMGCAELLGPGPGGYYWPNEMNGSASHQWVWSNVSWYEEGYRLAVSYAEAMMGPALEELPAMIICVHDP